MKYRTIVADPPWQVRTGPMSGGGMAEGFVGGDGRSRPLRYPTMSLEEIVALPVSRWAEQDCHLYLWVPNRWVGAAFDVVRSWGFGYSTLLVWRKAPMGGGLGGAFGISSEYVLYCRRGRLPAKTRVRGTVFDWKRPYDERGKPKHSAKPPEFTEMVEGVSHAPYLELFSRSKDARPGWAYWGDESLQTADWPLLDEEAA